MLNSLLSGAVRWRWKGPGRDFRAKCSFQVSAYREIGARLGRTGTQAICEHGILLLLLMVIETGASEMRDHARDWSERGRRPRGFASRSLQSLLLWARKERDCVQSTDGDNDNGGVADGDNDGSGEADGDNDSGGEADGDNDSGGERKHDDNGGASAG